MKGVVSGILLMLLFMSILILAVEIRPVKSEWSGTIYIRADGSIYPPDAPIVTYDNVTYTLKDNITSSGDGIFVERGNIVVDGAGYTLKGSKFGTGIIVSGRCNVNNVTITNTKIENFFYGVILDLSSNNTVLGNIFVGCGILVWYSCGNTVVENSVNDKPLVYLEDASDVTVEDAGQVILVNCNWIIVKNLNLSRTSVGIQLLKTNNTVIYGNNIENNNYYGVYVQHSLNNTFSDNNITTNDVGGVYLQFSLSNTFSDNNIINNGYGIFLYNSSNNKIFSNNIRDNKIGLCFSHSFNNNIYHNNFVNDIQIYPAEPECKSINAWDDGYPSGGNYWSDYLKKYTDAEELAGSGLWSIPYTINENNIDRYPLMYPYGTQTYKLIITTTAGGTTNPPPRIHTYANGTTAEVTAIPNIGYSFDYWLLDCEIRTENPINIIMTSNHTLETHFIDNIKPEVGDPVQDPTPDNVQPHQEVRVWANVTDFGTGIKNVTLWYSLDNGTTWTLINMTAYSTIYEALWGATIPGYGNCTWITYKIIAYDNAGNNATKDNEGFYYKYHVIPEYPSPIIPPLLMTLFVISALWEMEKKKHYLHDGSWSKKTTHQRF